MSERARWIFCALALVLGASGCSAETGRGRACAGDDDCPDGYCLDGRCEPRTTADAGPRPDAGPDAYVPMSDAAMPPADAAMPPSDSGLGFDPLGDTDGDGISDLHEGRATRADTDGDGVPDFMDRDADGDGIFDMVEAGDTNPATSPVDSDFDGTPDFRDLDSDDNGISDMAEGGSDDDGDTRPAFRDLDNDGDGFDDATEIGSDPTRPRDTNGDGRPDYQTPDSDGDTIYDALEGFIDTDADGSDDIYDLDTDGDGFPDALEAGDADLMTLPVDTDGDGTFDFRDPDSDGDGLSDAAERTSGSSRTRADTDGDGVSDLVEVGAGTDPLDGSESPRTRGDFVFVVPYMLPPDPTRDTLQFSTSLTKADVYFLMDNTGSMGGTIAALQSGLSSTVIPDIRSRISDAWFGVGGFDDYAVSSYGTAGCGSDTAGISHDVPFFQYQVMTSSTTTAQTAVNRYRTNCGYDGPESGVAALYALATRNTLGSRARFPGTSPPTCSGGARGAACFRTDAVPIIIVMTDVDQHNSPTCDPLYWGAGACDYAAVAGAPTWTSMTSALATLNARTVGIATAAGARPFLERLVTNTTLARGATGTAASYVLNATGGVGLSAAVTDAVRRAAAVPLDVSAQAVDVVHGESVDAVAAFVDRIETRGTAAPGLTCTTGLAITDRAGIDGDSYPDTFVDVTPGAPVCFDIVPRMNATVMPTLEPQVFRAQVNVLGDGFTPLDDRLIFFLVPPRIPNPNE